MESTKFICANCFGSFTRKENLIRHIRTLHPPKVQVNSNCFSNYSVHFECANCQKKFTRRDNLIVHHKTCIFKKSQQLFECNDCKKQYYCKANLLHHVQYHCTNLQIFPANIQCIECSTRFTTTKALNKHYEVDHHIQFVYENVQFECFKKFGEWKDKLEQEMICHFRIRNKYRTESKTKMHYICHRSGVYENRVKGTDRKRLMKLNGSKRIGGYCPASIIVSCNRTDDSCTALLQKVHIGHEVGNIHELKHMHLSKEEKMKLAVKLNVGATTAEMKRRRRLLDTNPETVRTDIINYAEVHNVSRKFKTEARKFNFGNDEVSVQSFIMQNSKSILYFKDKLENDEKYGLLENGDFMIVIMDAVQEENLRRYSHKVVAVDSTHGTNPQDFFLHTLLIVNVDFEGFPVAFALTNRNDCKGIAVFFKCIKDRVGIIKTRTFMSDMQLTYFNCWSNIMQPPERHLYCMWHVYDRWKKNLKKISNVEKKACIKQQLYSLASEMDVAVFEEGFQLFVSNFDDDTKNFMEYFNTYYAVCREKWAYCHRPDAEMNTNMHLERFHGIFKKNVTKGQKIISVTSCLQYLFEYLQIKEKDSLYKEIRGKMSSKLRNLQCRHKIAEKELANVNYIIVQPTSCNTWLVSSFTDSSLAQEMYTVKQREQSMVECGDDCSLVCVQCETCFHQYKCTCQDSCVKNNMCKHIHIVVMKGFEATHSIPDDIGIHTITSSVQVSSMQNDEKDELRRERIRAKLLVNKVLEGATNAQQVREIINQYIIPMKAALDSMNLIPRPSWPISLSHI